MSYNEDDSALANEPYFLRSFEGPLDSIYRRYNALWLESEHYFYKTYSESLSRDEKLIFIKLLFRKHDNCYELGEVADHYWRHINWQQNYTEAEIASDKQRVAQAVLKLIERKFLVRWLPEQKDQRHDINVLKSLQLPALKLLIQGLPDGKEAIKKFKKKEELIVWLVQRLQKFGDQPNFFTKKTFSESVWERFHEQNSSTICLDEWVTDRSCADSVRFLVCKDASTFFKRLHLLSHIFGAAIGGVNSSTASADSIGERVEGILTESLKPSVLEEINAVEYVKCSKSQCLGINSHSPLFETRSQLEGYERALGTVQEIRGPLTTQASVYRLGFRCVKHLIAYVENEVRQPDYSPMNKIPNEAEVLVDLRTRFPDSDPHNSDLSLTNPSPPERMKHHVHRRLTPEYLYSITLYELAQLLELGLMHPEGQKVKEYDLAIRWYQLILRVRATRMNRGKIFLRLLLDLRRHTNRPEEASRWADEALKEIFQLEPGFIIDIAKQIKLLVGKQSISRAQRTADQSAADSAPVENVIEIKDDDTSDDSALYSDDELALNSKKTRPVTAFKGIYQELAQYKTDSQVNFARLLTNLEKHINAAIPIRILMGRKLAQPPLKRATAKKSTRVTTSPSGSSDIDDDIEHLKNTSVVNSKFLWNGEWVSVETFALCNYLNSQTDEWIRGAKHGFYSERNKLRKRRWKLTEVSNVLEEASAEDQLTKNDWVGCHCEGSIVREICSLLLFPLVFNARVCPANADAFITDAQIASCDLSTTDFYEVRKSAIHAYLTLWQRLESKREIAFLLTLATSQLYEIRVMAATWNLHTNHPNAFKPADNLAAPTNLDEVDTLPPLRPSPLPSPQMSVKPPRTPLVSAATPHTQRKNYALSNAALRKTPTSKWNTPHQSRKRPIMRKVGRTNEVNLMLGYDRGVILQRSETLEIALERRLQSGIAYGLELSKVACGIPPEGLSQIMLHLCKCFPYWSNGLPDLLLWKNVVVNCRAECFEPCVVSSTCLAILMLLIDSQFLNADAVGDLLGLDPRAVDVESWLIILDHSNAPAISLAVVISDERAMSIIQTVWNSVCRFDELDCATVFAEVKGPGDQLSQKQKLWLYAMLGAGIDAHVCEVKASN